MNLSDYELITQTAFDVVHFSSQYSCESSASYSMRNLIGRSKVYPQYCDSDEAATFRAFGNWSHECPSALRPVKNALYGFSATDFVDVFFEHAVIPASIRIYENFNPGSIVRILGCYREADSKQPINTRRLRWLTLWRSPNCRYPAFFYKPELVQMFHLHMNGIHTPLLELLKLKEVDEDCIPPSLRFSARNEARLFEPRLNNLPMLPLDLIRIEVDTRLCSNYVELDAVELIGWTRVPPPKCLNWAKHIYALPPPSTEFSAREEDFLLNRFLLPPLNFTLPEPSNSMSVQSFSTLPLTFNGIHPLSIAEAPEEIAPLTLPVVPSSNHGVEIEELPCEGPPLSPWKGKISIPALYNSTLKEHRSGPLILLNRVNSFHEPQFTNGYSVTLLPFDLLLRIFRFLDINSLCRAACVCKLFYHLANETWAEMQELNLNGCWATVKSRTLVMLAMKLNRLAMLRRENMTQLVYSFKSDAVNSLYARAAFYKKRSRNISMRTSEMLSLPAPEEPMAPHNHRFNLKRKRSWSTNIVHDIQPTFSNDSALPMRELAALQLGKDSGRDSPEEETNVQYPTENPLLSDQNLSFKQCLRRLDLSWCGAYEKIRPCIFGRFLSDACTQLTTLRLSSCPFIDDECLLLIANKCRLLEELDLSSCLNVTHKGLDVLARLLHLRWLSLYRVRINDITLKVFASLWTKLEHLNLGSCCYEANNEPELSVLVADSLVELCAQNPGLRSLNLWRWDVLSPDHLTFIARSCQKLQEIDLGWCSSITDEAVVDLCRFCPCMKKLFLTAVRSVSVQAFESIANVLCDLEQLDLLGNSQVNLEYATMIVSKCTKLRLFELSWCSSITADELNELRQRYPRCFFQSADKLHAHQNNTLATLPQLPSSNRNLVLALGPVDPPDQDPLD